MTLRGSTRSGGEFGNGSPAASHSGLVGLGLTRSTVNPAASWPSLRVIGVSTRLLSTSSACCERNTPRRSNCGSPDGVRTYSHGRLGNHCSCRPENHQLMGRDTGSPWPSVLDAG